MRMFEKLSQRIEQRAGAVVENVIDGVKEAAASFPGIAVHREAGRIVLWGRGLFRRWIEDVRLRFALRVQR